jgi:hypothetical protein
LHAISSEANTPRHIIEKYVSKAPRFWDIVITRLQKKLADNGSACEWTAKATLFELICRFDMAADRTIGQAQNLFSAPIAASPHP